MCAICGIKLKKPGDLSEASRLCEGMANRMKHRGPDDYGFFADGKNGVVLGHRRLSIIDLSPAARQPFFNENRSIATLINGEIYNFKELRTKLIGQNHQFASQCDSEILGHLFEENGIACVNKLRGMYAACIFDISSGNLHLVRDPLGIKPLYIFECDDLIAFASEVRAFEALPQFRREFDIEGLSSFLLLGSIPAPYTGFREVRALRPGEIISIRNGILHSHGENPIPKWCSEIGALPKQSPTELNEVLRDSVRKHLISDAPIGVFLSGGIDSGAITGFASEVSATRIHTLSVTIPGDALDESSYARETANAYGTQHTEIPLDQAGFEADLDSFFDHLDFPSIDGLNTFIVSKAARKAGLTVTLSGVGGDELFGGYRTFELMPRFVRMQCIAGLGGDITRKAAAFSFHKLRPGSGGARIAELLRSAPADIRSAYLAYRGLFVGRFLNQVLKPEFTQHAQVAEDRFMEETKWATHNGISPRLAVGGLELTRYMSSQLLRDTDVMSMAHSLEVRTPLVDVDVIRAGLPFLSRGLEGDGHPKWLLRQGLSKSLPRAVVQRPKQGFIFPWQEWLRGFVLKDFDNRLKEFKSDDSFLNLESLKWWRDAYVQGWAHWSYFWALYVLIRMSSRSSPR
jgi:asparagine synthase (glutamine-hydrolysing)